MSVNYFMYRFKFIYRLIAHKIESYTANYLAD